MADNTPFQSATLATLPSGSAPATDDIGGVLYQRVKRAVGADGLAADCLDQVSQANTYTATGTGTVINVAFQGMSRPSLQVKQTGTVTAWTVVVEASLDGTNYDTLFPILKHTKTSDGTETVAGDLAIAWPGANRYPAFYFRTRCTALTLGAGTNVIATLVVLP